MQIVSDYEYLLPVKDIEYYSEPLIFRVGETLFRVPREYLSQESTVFRSLLELAQPAGEEHRDGAEGSVDVNPIVLPSTIDTLSFRALLKLIYCDTPSASNLSKEEWISVLELARMWDMSKIRDIVIEQLGPLLEDDPTKKWDFGKNYEIGGWVQSALEKLIRRNEPLGERESQTLDQETMLKIAAVRESCYPVFSDSDWDCYYGDEDITVVRWEVRQERGEIASIPTGLNFECPPPQISRDVGEQVVPAVGSTSLRNAEFYFENVVFKLENYLYKVSNKPFVQHSPVFRRRFEQRGFVKYDRHDPYIIEDGVSTTDFVSLLRFFFPPKITGEREPSFEEWVSILRLSAKWDMLELNKLAMRKLTGYDFGGIHIKLQISQELGIAEWFSSAMTTLVTRQEPLTPFECQILNQAHILQVLDLRERVHARYDRYGSFIVHLRTERGELPQSNDLKVQLAALVVL